MKAGLQWWMCRDRHAKMLSDMRPLCPVCHIIMDEMQAVLDGVVGPLHGQGATQSTQEGMPVLQGGVVGAGRREGRD
jgi:hypothetical protein